MPVKKKKAGKAKAGKAGKKRGSKKGKGKKNGLSAAAKKPPPVADPLGFEAMLNAYYIAHGPVQFLQFRGYTPPGSAGGSGKKKKKAGGKRKKK